MNTSARGATSWIDRSVHDPQPWKANETTLTSYVHYIDRYVCMFCPSHSIRFWSHEMLFSSCWHIGFTVAGLPSIPHVVHDWHDKWSFPETVRHNRSSLFHHRDDNDDDHIIEYKRHLRRIESIDIYRYRYEAICVSDPKMGDPSRVDTVGPLYVSRAEPLAVSGHRSWKVSGLEQCSVCASSNENHVVSNTHHEMIHARQKCASVFPYETCRRTSMRIWIWIWV